MNSDACICCAADMEGSSRCPFCGCKEHSAQIHAHARDHARVQSAKLKAVADALSASDFDISSAIRLKEATP